MSALPKRILVSAIIPTTGRAALERAYRSVLACGAGSLVEVIIVVDRNGFVPPFEVRPEDQVIQSGGGLGGAAARNLGVSAASGDYVAFLDDDDEWLPSKLDIQLARARSIEDRGLRPVISGRHRQISHDGKVASGAVPAHIYAENCPVEDYLFLSRRPTGGRASMYTSTFLMPRDLALECPWDSGLPRHQDWDLLVRLGRMPRVRISQVEDVVAAIHTGSAGSISASTDWHSSLNWADSVLSASGTRTYVDFLAAQTLRYALGARSARGAYEVMMRFIRTRRVPSFGPLVVGLGGLAPRRLVEYYAARTG